MPIFAKWPIIVLGGLALTTTLAVFKTWDYRSKAIRFEQQRDEAVRLAPLGFAAEVVRRDAGLPVRGQIQDRAALVAIRDYISRSMNYADEDIPGGYRGSVLHVSEF
jgi:hypothetical protein